jgi:hypothetical protein
MTTYRISISLAVLAPLSYLAVNVAQGQRVATAPRVSSARARTAPTRLATSARANTKSAAVSAHSRSAVSANSFFSGNGVGPFGPFPGLGFNSGFTNSDWILAAIDPATQWRLFEAQRFSRNVGFAPGFYLFDGGAYYAPAEPGEAEPAPQEQAAAAETPPAEAPRTEQAPAQVESAPLEDVGQFILVLRSGRQVEAVAFTRADDHIVYVTADGFRRTLALADLDPDATIRINEERGTPLEIPL